MVSAVDSRLAYARPSAVATASRLPTANRGSNNSYTTSSNTTLVAEGAPIPLCWLYQQSGIGARMYKWETRMLLKHYLDRGVSKAELSRRFGVNRRTIHN